MILTQAKVLPQNHDAEQGLLGALLTDNRAYDAISAITIPDHFYAPWHQRIFVAISNFINEGKTASPVTLKNHFENDIDLQSVGGASYLAELAASVVSVINAADYALTLKDAWQRRNLIEAAHKIIDFSSTFSLETRGEALSEAEKLITSLADIRSSSQCSAHDAALEAGDWMQAVKNGKIKPFMTGIPSLDQKISGLFPGRLYVIGGRPAMGKTACGMSIADNVSAEHPALFISLELGRKELAGRLVACRSGVSVNRQQSRDPLSKQEWYSIAGAQTDLIERKLFIEDSHGADIHTIKSIARKFKRQHGQFLLVIDYLGLISLDKKIQSKVHQIEEITTNLKRLAKELDIPVILLSQLSRGLEGREDKRPGLSDLRDSGSIEQDADVVIFIYREEYYLEKDSCPSKKEKESHEQFQYRMMDWEAKKDAAKGKAELIVSKNRQGSCGSVQVNFNGIKQRFYE